jgi:hypothetical protein
MSKERDWKRYTFIMEKMKIKNKFLFSTQEDRDILDKCDRLLVWYVFLLPVKGRFLNCT